MKRLIILSFSLFISLNLFSQSNLDDTEKLASLCKVWGFLKYYHPVASKGKLDWDAELEKNFGKVIEAKNKEELSKVYAEWIASLGKIKPCNKCHKEASNVFKDNLNIDWINDSHLFTDSLISELNYVLMNRNTGSHYYAKTDLDGAVIFQNEKSYKDSIYPSSPMRLLTLARYWNIINYYFPYKYVIGEDWNKVLTDLLPKFIDAKDIMQYYLAMAELIARTNDSHAYFTTLFTNRHFGLLLLPFIGKFAQDKIIVTNFLNDSLAKNDDIQIGDAVISIQGKTIPEIINENGKYISASNYPRKIQESLFTIYRGFTDTTSILFERNGITKSKIVHRYKWSDLHINYDELNNKNKNSAWKILQDEIGYVDMGLLQDSNVKKMMKDLSDKKAIIFDIRNYPNGTMDEIAKYLNKEKKPFAKFTMPLESYPGLFKNTPPYYCGRKNKNYYKGKVILLFNEATLSHAEFTCMALQTAPNVTCIGSQTAGADGNTVEITLPGNYTFYMSGIGVYYPDGRETQRIGIVPDIEVKPTVAGIRNKKDEVMERAIEFIKTGK